MRSTIHFDEEIDFDRQPACSLQTLFVQAHETLSLDLTFSADYNTRVQLNARLNVDLIFAIFYPHQNHLIPCTGKLQIQKLAKVIYIYNVAKETEPSLANAWDKI